MSNLLKEIEVMEDDLINQIIKNIKINNRSYDLIQKGDIKKWQDLQKIELEKFKKENKKRIQEHSSKKINESSKKQVTEYFNKGKKATEKQIEDAINEGFNKYNKEKRTQAELEVGERKLNALINELGGNMKKVEYSAVAFVENKYNKILFDTNVHFMRGDITLAQAIDASTKDFLSNGINSVEYKNGARVNVQSYAEMALRTANKRAYMQGEAEMRDEYGLHLVIVTNRGDACPKCMKWVGRVYIDDVYGGGTPDGKHRLLSEAIAGGLYHPNCKDVHTTYFEGITTDKNIPTEAEREEAERIYNLEQKQRYYERTIRKYDRLSKGTIDEAQSQKYKDLKRTWQEKNRKLIKENPELRRRYYREQAVTLPKTTVNKTVKYNNTPFIEQGKNREEIYNIFNNRKIQYNKSNMDKMSDQYFMESANQFIKLESQYKTGFNTEIKTYKRKSKTNAFNSLYYNTIFENENKASISFNLNHNNEKNIKENLLFEIQEGFKMPIKKGNELRYTITHEYGHMLEMKIEKQIIKNTKDTEILDELTEKFFKKDKEKYYYLYGVQDDIEEVLQYNARQKAMANYEQKMAINIRRDIIQTFRNMYPDDEILQYVSDYGKSDTHEFFAELFANANLGAPNKAGQAMIEYLKEQAKNGIISI